MLRHVQQQDNRTFFTVHTGSKANFTTKVKLWSTKKKPKHKPLGIGTNVYWPAGIVRAGFFVYTCSVYWIGRASRHV